MARGTNFYKLGIFVLVGAAVLFGSIALLVWRSWNTKTVRYLSYFDESVQGLDIGSPVKFRGVTVGQVAAIEIAPDRRHVEVTSELAVAQLVRLNLRVGAEEGIAAAPALRVQLAQTGITGVKFVLIDFFDGEHEAPPALPFPTPGNYIPSAPSTMKNLESSLVETADRFPDMARQLGETLGRMNRVMESLEESRLPERASASFEQLGDTLTALNAPALARQTQATLGAFDRSLGRADRVFERVEGPNGLLARAERATSAVAEMAGGSDALGPELGLTLREVRSAARSIRRFAEALERDPDMLLKGRAEADH